MSTSTLTTAQIDALYSIPKTSSPHSIQTPNITPGASVESAEELARLLKEDAIKWHVFFNDKGFHNHLTHHLYAAYALGAPPNIIKEAYDLHSKYQRKAFPSPDPITDQNWKDHLGSENYYQSYLHFFSEKVLAQGMSSALEKYVFSLDANLNAPKDASPPYMLSRFLGGLLHPLIHFGHGAEFNVLGQAAQGLAWTAVHSPDLAALMPKEFFAKPSSEGAISRLTQLMAPLTLGSSPPAKSVHAFSILARMLRDDALKPEPDNVEEGSDRITKFLESKGHLIRQYASQWIVTAQNEDELKSKLEELSWVAVLLYGVGGWNESRAFRADFFTMHFLTSSLFLPAILPHLQAEAQSALLRGWFSVVLSYWIKRGRPNLHIEAFYKANAATIVVPGPIPTPDDSTLGKHYLTPNPWLPLIQSTIMHPDEHFLKAQRAAVHYSVVYGHRAKGSFVGTELTGAELLDGTLFIRVAGLTSNRLGWTREGGERGEWDRIGFADDKP